MTKPVQAQAPTASTRFEADFNKSGARNRRKFFFADQAFLAGGVRFSRRHLCKHEDPAVRKCGHVSPSCSLAQNNEKHLRAVDPNKENSKGKRSRNVSYGVESPSRESNESTSEGDRLCVPVFFWHTVVHLGDRILRMKLSKNVEKR